jgi:hypothetical protein
MCDHGNDSRKYQKAICILSFKIINMILVVSARLVTIVETIKEIHVACLHIYLV